jgi:hypothetical protein
MIIELQEQLLARERELDNREGAIVAWGESLTVFARALREVTTECDASRTRAAATLWDYSTQVSASSSQSERLKAFSQMLKECAALLGLQEMDLEVRKAILVEELEHGLHPPDGQDPSAELDKVRVRVDRIVDDHAAPKLSGYRCRSRSSSAS